MKACILNSYDKIVENVIELDSLDPSDFVPYKPGIELASRHDGEIGWRLLPDNSWETNEVSPTDDQIAFVMRRRRNNLLKRSDRYVLLDFPITEAKRQEWINYRQALRNVTEQAGFPHTIVWPQKPE